jgi:hypothetical protein
LISSLFSRLFSNMHWPVSCCCSFWLSDLGSGACGSANSDSTLSWLEMGITLKDPLSTRVPHRWCRIITSDLRARSSDAAAHGDEEASSVNLHTNIYTYTAHTTIKQSIDTHTRLHQIAKPRGSSPCALESHL